MIKEKQWYIYLIIIVGTVGLVYSFVEGSKKELIDLTTADQTAVVEPIQNIPDEKKEEVWEAIKVMLESHTLEGITAIDIIEGEMEIDAYNRYFTTFQVLGVDATEVISLYDYYMVIQENREGELYILPFGYEVVPSYQETVKKDITASILKIANGWGTPEEAFREKWTNKVKSSDTTMAEEESSMRSIYSAQQIIAFMRKYIGDWLVAIDTEDRAILTKYYEEGSNIQKQHLRVLDMMKKEKMTIEVYELEVLDVICREVEGVFQVTIEGNMQTYSHEEIRAINQTSVYTLKEKDGSFIVVNEELIKKE